MELKGQTTRKKELFQKYEKTAKAILSENHLDELA
jgi:hypothetical protein